MSRVEIFFTQLKMMMNHLNLLAKLIFNLLVIEHNFVKAWKKHTKMTCNLLVPHGKVEFVIFDDRNANAENHCFAKICLSKENYKRLTIPPKVWFGFKGVDKENSIILNVSDMKHDPDEVQRASLDEILFNWEI